MDGKRKTRRVPTRVSASMFFKYDACPHWLYFDVYGDPSKKKKLTAFAEMLLDMGVRHEKDLIAGMDFVEVPAKGGNAARARETLKRMREGVHRIYHGVLMTDDLIGEPDILEKRTDKGSDLGAYHYVAIDIKSAERLTDAHKYQLVCYGELLKVVQGVRPDEGYILNASGSTIGFPLREFEQQFHRALDEVKEMHRGVIPPAHLSSGCKQSPWFGECKALAERTNDIALLYNVRKKSVLALRERGIATVADVLAMDVDALADRSKYLTRSLLERIQVQARALAEHRHFVRRPIQLPTAPLELFFDIEGDPLRQVEYLFGFLVRKDGEERYEYQLAERPEDEWKMWEAFLDWIERLPEDYVVYHYGTYERTRLDMLERRHGCTKALDRFRERLVDLNEIVKDCIVFPLYFYGIKDIGTFIGYERSGKITGGGESVAFYEEWLDSGKRKKLDEIIIYNEDDVVATRFLKDWLARQSAAPHEGSTLPASK